MYQYASYREAGKNLSCHDYWSLLGSIAELRLDNFKEAHSYSEALYELREKYLNQLHSLIGEDKLEAYLKLHNKRLEEMKKARKKLSSTMKGLVKLEKLRDKAVKDSKELIDRSGIDKEEVQKLQREFVKRAAILNRKFISNGDGPQSDYTDNDYGGNQTYHPPWI